MTLTRSQQILLETIDKYDGEWNWYKLGRLCLPSSTARPSSLSSLSWKRVTLKKSPTKANPSLDSHMTQAGKAAIQWTRSTAGRS